MNEANKRICRHIKIGIDSAREEGVWCSYPEGVWINDQYHRWPFDRGVSPLVKSITHAMATFEPEAK